MQTRCASITISSGTIRIMNRNLKGTIESPQFGCYLQKESIQFTAQGERKLCHNSDAWEFLRCSAFYVQMGWLPPHASEVQGLWMWLWRRMTDWSILVHAGAELLGGHHKWACTESCVKTFLHGSHNSTTSCPAKDSKSLSRARSGTLHWKPAKGADTSTVHEILTLQM